MSLLVSNIQRMCLQDGPGIRTTVFLKGCSLRCPWCSNPENIPCGRQYYFQSSVCAENRGKSQSCASCIREAVLQADCDKDAHFCPFGAIGVYGKDYGAPELVHTLLKDRAYWKRIGGVTFSGGEPLLQARGLKEVLQLLKEHGVHVVFETALHVPAAAVEMVIDLVDAFYVDLKVLEPQPCEEALGGRLDWFHNNLRLLAAAQKDVVFRIPCSDAFTLTDGNVEALKELLRAHPDHPVELFSLHRLGAGKYRSIGREPAPDYPADRQKMERLAAWINEACGNVSIITI